MRMAALYLNRYRIVAPSVPTPQRYHDLRKICGLTPPQADLVAVAAALPKTYHGVTIIDTEYSGAEGDEVVGMGRLVGDGTLFLLLTDVCVAPEHQGKVMARLIMEELVSHVDEHCPAAHIVLCGDPPAHERVYPKYGFAQYKTSVGMFRWGSQRAKELAESSTSGWYKDAEGKPQTPAYATAWAEKQAAKGD